MLRFLAASLQAAPRHGGRHVRELAIAFAVARVLATPFTRSRLPTQQSASMAQKRNAGRTSTTKDSWKLILRSTLLDNAASLFHPTSGRSLYHAGGWTCVFGF